MREQVCTCTCRRLGRGGSALKIISIGTAGWNIPRPAAGQFSGTGTALERYATRLQVAEINSPFYRPHRISTWARWRANVPPNFRFSVKMPKAITHQRRLIGCEDALGQFITESWTLAEKLAVFLVQLPPSLQFDETIANAFFRSLHFFTPRRLLASPAMPAGLQPMPMLF